MKEAATYKWRRKARKRASDLLSGKRKVKAARAEERVLARKNYAAPTYLQCPRPEHARLRALVIAQGESVVSHQHRDGHARQGHVGGRQLPTVDRPPVSHFAGEVRLLLLKPKLNNKGFAFMQYFFHL